MTTGDATKVLKSEGIFPCIECKYSKLPYRLDDFHMNAQCTSPMNMTIKVSPVTYTEYPEYKAQFCKDTRSNSDLCGPKGVWFESSIHPIQDANAVVEEVQKAPDGTRTAKSSSKASR